MNIKDILSNLGLDLTNPEVKRGALEAIEAILASRTPLNSPELSGGAESNNTTEVELDPDLIQPSIKQASSGVNNDDIEIEDEDNILDQIKHNDSEATIENTNATGNDSDSNESDSSQSSDNTDGTETTDDSTTQDSASDVSEEERGNKSSTEAEEDSTSKISDSEGGAYENDEEEVTDDIGNNSKDFEKGEKAEEPDDINFADDSESADENPKKDTEGAMDEDNFGFDENDLIDDELKNSTEDEAVTTKHNARKIKRERTLAAAKKALADAQVKKVSPALIRELEKSIEALEALTEAVTKSLKDISDEEFNRLLNRVFDAIDACGDSGLTFTSEEERRATVQEIKADMSSAQTQAELSAEDVAKIRAETQAVKARERESDKLKARSASSFKGFQEFLNSLYRAIALQVQTEETRDDSWSAISRRNSGAGVLKQGQKVNDIPNKKIPVIDFYFDQSSSWGPQDIKVGKKAVATLADMEDKGQIKLNIFYFADKVSNVPIRGSTSGWNEIVKNVIATQATNVVIMTDADMQNWWEPQDKPPLRYTVPGYVWYLWKDGDNAPRLPQDLNGRGGVQQFSFNINNV